MFKPLFCALILILPSLWLAALQPDFAADPAISPDGETICFAYDNDLWLVPFAGGTARRLTATEASEWGPCWSPDGSYIAFNSDREGTSYPYLIPSAGGEARVIIAEPYTISDWFNDSANLLCTRYSQAFGSSFYKVPVDGSRPILLAEIGNRYASLSPDNKSIVFNRNGDPHREAYQGSVAGELWKVDLASKTYTRLTETPYTERYPRFSHTGNALYYCASDGERFQIHSVEKLDFSKPAQLTNLREWSARDISIARANDRMVFEYFNELWTYDPALPRQMDQKAAKLSFVIPEDMWRQYTRREKVKADFGSFAVSDDQLLVAFIDSHDAFLVPRKGGEVRQLTDGLASTGNLEFMEDGRTLVLQQLDRGLEKLYVATWDSLATTLAQLDWFGRDSLDVESFYRDDSGKWVVYYGDNRVSGRIAVAGQDLKDLKSLGVDRPVTSNFAINSSGDYAVYASTREDVWMRELWLYDLATGESRKLMNDDAWIRGLTWTPDDRSLLISRADGIYRLDLLPRDEFEYDQDHWIEIYAPQDSTDAIQAGDKATEDESVDQDVSGKPRRELKVVWEDLERRLYPVITDPDSYLTVERVISDSTFYYYSEGREEGDSAALKKANVYGKNVKTEFDLGKDPGARDWSGDTLYYVRDGALRYYNPDKGSKGEVKAEFDYQYDEKLLNLRVFEQVWGRFGLNFYDPNMHGKNWDQLYRLYRPYAAKARGIGDIATIVNEMIGDVNASHTGFYPRRERASTARQTASLGLELDYGSQLREGIRIAKVYPTSRLASFYGMKAGDLLLAIDGVSITAKTPVDSLLLDKVGKRIRLAWSAGGVRRDAILNGLSWGENRRLFYADKVNASKSAVDRETSGRVGYIHIPGMGNRDYDNFVRDLFRDNADKEALIIDVRGNTGGHIHDQIITLLSKTPYAWSTSRRYTGERNQEPRRAWTRPSIVLVDEGSFSDGEIFPTVYQQLKLGKVIGVPSSGSVIGTWEYELMDGSSMRMPGSGWYRMDGTNMEGNGVMPDIIVEISPEDEIAGRDPQLQRAIAEIMKELR